MGLYHIQVTLLALCCAAAYASSVNEASEFDVEEKRTPKLSFKMFSPIVDLDSFEPFDTIPNKRNAVEMTNQNTPQRDTRAPLGTMRFGKRDKIGTMRFGKRGQIGTMRFGKRAALGTMRFGKRSIDDLHARFGPMQNLFE